MSKYVEINIDDKFLSKHYPNILGEVVEDVITDVENREITPYFTGATQQSMETSTQVYSRSAAIMNTTPYASKICTQIGHKFSKKKNKHAQAEWFDPYVNGVGKDMIEKSFAEAIKREGGD